MKTEKRYDLEGFPYLIRIFKFCNECKYHDSCELDMMKSDHIILTDENLIKTFCGFESKESVNEK